MIIAPYCCCDRPEILERKRLIITLNLNFWTKFFPDQTGNGTIFDWGYDSYRTDEQVYFRHHYRQEIFYNGISTYVYDFWGEFDPFSGHFTTNATNPQEELRARGADLYYLSFVTPTYAKQDVTITDGGGGSVRTLTESWLEKPSILDNILAHFIAEMDRILPTETMRQRNQIGYCTAAGENRVCALDFASQLPPGFDWINAVETNSLRMFPNPVSPWDGRYRLLPNNHPDGFGAFPEFFENNDYYFFPGQLWAGRPSVGPVWDGTQYVMQQPTRNLGTASRAKTFVFMKSCLALPDGLGCGTNTALSDASIAYNLGDVVLGQFAPSASPQFVSRLAPQLVLAPGYYSFDGARMIIHSGAKIAPASAVPGLDGAAAHYGLIGGRVEYFDPTPPPQDFLAVPDECPP